MVTVLKQKKPSQLQYCFMHVDTQSKCLLIQCYQTLTQYCQQPGLVLQGNSQGGASEIGWNLPSIWFMEPNFLLDERGENKQVTLQLSVGDPSNCCSKTRGTEYSFLSKPENFYSKHIFGAL